MKLVNCKKIVLINKIQNTSVKAPKNRVVWLLLESSVLKKLSGEMLFSIGFNKWRLLVELSSAKIETIGIKEPILKVSKKPTIIVKNNTKIKVFFSLFEKELKISINNFIF